MFFTHHLLGFVLLGVLLISPACAAPRPVRPASPPPYTPYKPPIELPAYDRLSFQAQVVDINGHPLQAPSVTRFLKESIKKVVDKLHKNNPTVDLKNIEVAELGEHVQFDTFYLDILYYKLEGLSPVDTWCSTLDPTSTTHHGYIVPPGKYNPSKFANGGLLSTCGADHVVTQEPFTHEADPALLKFLTSFVPVEEAAMQMAKENRLPEKMNAEVLRILSELRKPKRPIGTRLKQFGKFLTIHGKKPVGH
ncbi:hypothetical protein BDP27DRAFT_1335128 [Rhodocollybia butyracea]|uniref:Uncharacterized protein n=1 Tax=Rhodocollybia butyracea TaxID=206335 RepID=A0A9P5U2H2_9AGAR|nr:hypothetical protein BDP27DRAFT_1335128 [Rhodocollybia butyracea]